MRVDLARRGDFTGRMRMLLLAIALGLLAVAGCARKQATFVALPAGSSGARPAKPPTENQTLIITPENTRVGKVAGVNQEARFVVLNFPVGHLPPLAQHMSLYRRGLKVGEVKITGPQLDDDVDADLLNGDAEVGDEV